MNPILAIVPAWVSNPLNIAVAIALIVLTVAALLMRSRRPWLVRIQRKPLLTANETELPITRRLGRPKNI